MKSLPQLYLVRHGETAWSLTGQHTGLTDIPLTEHGKDQARRLAPRLRQIGFSRVLVSPRLRARQTCELAGLAAESVAEPDLAEWDYGEYEGLNSVDIRRARSNWSVWRDGCPGGESPAAMSARVDRLIVHLCSMAGNIALFSHGQLGAALAVRWIGMPIAAGAHFALHPATLSILGHEPANPTQPLIELWNETEGWERGRR